MKSFNTYPNYKLKYRLNLCFKIFISINQIFKLFNILFMYKIRK